MREREIALRFFQEQAAKEHLKNTIIHAHIGWPRSYCYMTEEQKRLYDERGAWYRSWVNRNYTGKKGPYVVVKRRKTVSDYEKYPYLLVQKGR